MATAMLIRVKPTFKPHMNCLKFLLLIFEENCFNCNYGLNKLVNRDCVTR